MVDVKKTTSQRKKSGSPPKKTTSQRKKSGSKPKITTVPRKKSSSQSKIMTVARKKSSSRSKAKIMTMPRINSPVMSARLSKLGLANFFRKGPVQNNMSKSHFARFVGKKRTRKLRMKPRKLAAFKKMKPHPIKTIIPPWIDKKYIKHGRVDWEAYSK
jgi:hypothetical protein